MATISRVYANSARHRLDVWADWRRGNVAFNWRRTLGRYEEKAIRHVRPRCVSSSVRLNGTMGVEEEGLRWQLEGPGSQWICWPFPMTHHASSLSLTDSLRVHPILLASDSFRLYSFASMDIFPPFLLSFVLLLLLSFVFSCRERERERDHRQVETMLSVGIENWKIGLNHVESHCLDNRKGKGFWKAKFWLE